LFLCSFLFHGPARRSPIITAVIALERQVKPGVPLNASLHPANGDFASTGNDEQQLTLL